MKDKNFNIDNNGDELKKSPLTLPEGYFEEFPSKILDRIRQEERQENSEIPSRNRRYLIRYTVAVAASVLGIAMISLIAVRFLTGNGSQSTNDIDFALLEEMNIIHEDSDLIEFYDTGDEAYSDEDAWIENAVDYLASVDIDMDLLINEY